MLKQLRSSPGKPSRVVILGAQGFVSIYLQKWCRRHEIPFRAVSSSEVDLTNSDSAVRLAAFLEADDVIVMTSAIQPNKGRDYRALMANLRMVETVIMALEKSMCAQFVCLSSDAIYDANKIPLDEDSTREPVDLYALSHVAREMLLSSTLERRQIPLCILRLTAIYGPGDTHNGYGPNQFVRSALKDGRIVLFGRGEERRSHIHIDDTIDAIGRSIMHRSAGTLNVAIRRALSYREVADTVARVVKKSVEICYAPRTVPVVQKPYKPTQIFRFIYNLGRPIGPVVHRTFVNTALFDAFPDFKFTSLEEGIASFIAAEREIMSSPAAANGGKQIGVART